MADSLPFEMSKFKHSPPRASDLYGDAGAPPVSRNVSEECSVRSFEGGRPTGTRRVTDDLVCGAMGGILATAAMSVAFVVGQRLRSIGSLPPEIIVRATVTHDARAVAPVATLAHFGYGAAAGSGFAILRGNRNSGALGGMLFGLAVWSLSYEGWLPAAGILPPAHRDDRARAVTILAAHLVYGTALGLLDRFCRNPRRLK